MDIGRKSSHWDLVGWTWPDLRSFLHAGCCCSTRSQRSNGTSPRRAPWTSQRSQRFQRLAWSSPRRALWWTSARCWPPTSSSPFPGRLTLTLTRSSTPSPPSLLFHPSLGLDVGYQIFMPSGKFSGFHHAFEIPIICWSSLTFSPGLIWVFFCFVWNPLIWMINWGTNAL